MTLRSSHRDESCRISTVVVSPASRPDIHLHRTAEHWHPPWPENPFQKQLRLDRVFVLLIWTCKILQMCAIGCALEDRIHFKCEQKFLRASAKVLFVEFAESFNHFPNNGLLMSHNSLTTAPIVCFLRFHLRRGENPMMTLLFHCQGSSANGISVAPGVCKP